MGDSRAVVSFSGPRTNLVSWAIVSCRSGPQTNLVSGPISTKESGQGALSLNIFENYILGRQFLTPFQLLKTVPIQLLGFFGRVLFLTFSISRSTQRKFFWCPIYTTLVVFLSHFLKLNV